jgi:hypothetical protein
MQTFPIRVFKNIFGSDDEFRIVFTELDEIVSMNISSKHLLTINIGELYTTLKLPELIGVWEEPTNPNYHYFLNGETLTRFNLNESQEMLPFISGREKASTYAIYNSVILYQQKLRELYSSNKVVSIV